MCSHSVYLADWPKGCKMRWFLGPSLAQQCIVESADHRVQWEKWALNCTPVTIVGQNELPSLPEPLGRENWAQPPSASKSGKIYKTGWVDLKTTRRFIHKSKTARLIPKRAYFEIPTGRQSTLSPRALFHGGHQHRKLRKGTTGMTQGVTQTRLTHSYRLHQEESWYSYTDCPLLPEKQTAISAETIYYWK